MKNLIIKLMGAIMMMVLLFACTDDKYDAPAEDYGFVQFKLLKNGGITNTRATNADQLDSLAYAKKIRITLKSDYDLIEQTLELSAVNNSETEQGLWSEKCKLLKGSYRIAGYELLDNLDQSILTYDEEAGNPFEIVAGGLQVETILVNVRPRGLVQFRLTKDFSQLTRAASPYRLEQVAKADITIENRQTGELQRITGIRTQMEYYYESETDKTTHSRILCDTLVALKAGDYTATSFVVYDKSNSILEGAIVEAENQFSVSDNKNTIADVPITMRETSAAIHDGLILKKIWDALDGPNWSYRGIGYTKGCNWEFERDIDLWVAQPGVRILDDGHVASLALGGFGARGHMPEELGELSKLRSLTIGTHDDGVGKSPINEVDPDEIVEAVRADFKAIAAPNHGLDMMATEMWSALPDTVTAKIRSLRERGARTAAGLNARANDPNNYSSAVYSLPASIKNLKELKSFFIANCPIAKLPDELAELTACTDVEIYNCPNLKEIPAGLWKMPKLEMVYFVNNNGISAEKLYEGLQDLARSAAAKTLQGLYFMNNNLEVVPDLRAVTKLGFLSLENNKIERFDAPFGKTHNFGTLNLANNRLSELPRDEQGYFAGCEAVETWSFSGNQFTEFPDIFDASGYLMGTVDFSQNKISSFEHGDNFRGVNTEILNISFNPLQVFPRCIYNSGSKINYLVMRNCSIREFESDALAGEYAYITAALDLAGNRLKELPTEFNNRTFGYMTGLDLSGNAFESFAWRPMNIANLRTFIFRGQRNDEGVRCMREWPVGIYAHVGLSSLYLGSNDIRKVTDYTLNRIRFFVDLTDNPNISIDLTDACPYIRAGLSYFLFDPGQDVRGCDGLVPEY